MHNNIEFLLYLKIQILWYEHLAWLKLFCDFLRLNVNKGPTRCNSMQTFIHCHVTLHVSGVTHPSSGALKTVSATSGVCRGHGTVTSFHRGLIRTAVRIRPRWKEVTVP